MSTDIAWSKQYFTKLDWKSLRAYNKNEISSKHNYYIKKMKDKPIWTEFLHGNVLSGINVYIQGIR